MAGNTSPKRITIPKDWPEFVKSAIIHVISLAGFVISNTRGLVVKGTHGSAQYKIQNEALEHEIGLLKEELLIKDARKSMIDALKPGHKTDWLFWNSKPCGAGRQQKSHGGSCFVL